MNKHNVILGGGVELKKKTIIHLEVILTNTESLLLKLILKKGEIKSEFEFDDCYSPSRISDELTIKLKHLLLHDGETREKFIGVVTARKLMKVCKIQILNDFPFVIFLIEIGDFETRVRINKDNVSEFLKIENLNTELNSK